MIECGSMRVRKMREQDLDLILAWRNNPKVRRFMLSQHEISEHEHRLWFNTISKDTTLVNLVIEDQNQPVVYVRFSGVQPNSTSIWSFFRSPENISGIGKRGCSMALDFAFKELKVHKVVGYVLAYNFSSIRLHQSLGFIQDGIILEHRSIDGNNHNLLCFEILSTEWILREK
jgi:UDP-4-amino-4,6-dideoxy-N-acetyl-beta-L-altrosamine N-acetyltransferase